MFIKNTKSAQTNRGRISSKYRESASNANCKFCSRGILSNADRSAQRLVKSNPLSPDLSAFNIYIKDDLKRL